MESFDSSWWKIFTEKTEDLTKPLLSESVLEENEIIDLTNYSYEVLRNLGKVVNPKLRIYVDGIQSENNNAILFKNPPQNNEPIHDWANRCFGDKVFGIILNSCQDYSEDLKKTIARRFLPLLEENGIPLGGLEISMFVGNYGYTPLGYHKDPMGHKVFHLHLGPGVKTMNLIEKDKFVKDLSDVTLGHHNGSNRFEELDKHAESYHIKGGDVFFMPIETYHVGNNPDLSIGITVWHIEPTINEFLRLLTFDFQKLLFKENLTNDYMIVKDFSDVTDVSDLSEKVMSRLVMNKTIAKKNVYQLFEQLVKEAKYKLYSNCYYQTFGKIHKKRAHEFQVEDILLGDDLFKIYHDSSEEGEDLYIRGFKIQFPPNSGMSAVVEQLNGGDTIKCRELFALLEGEWEEDLIEYFVDQLYAKNAFNILLNSSVASE